MAGAAHLGYHEAQESAPLQARDLPPSTAPTCDLPPLSRVPWHDVVDAACDHMVVWVKHDVAPPIGDNLEVAAFGTQSVLARDEFGNALGGIRLSQHAVATATNTGVNGPAATACRWFGSYVPFSQATLDALSPAHQMLSSEVDRATEGAFDDVYRLTVNRPRLSVALDTRLRLASRTLTDDSVGTGLAA